MHCFSFDVKLKNGTLLKIDTYVEIASPVQGIIDAVDPIYTTYGKDVEYIRNTGMFRVSETGVPLKHIMRDGEFFNSPRPGEKIRTVRPDIH